MRSRGRAADGPRPDGAAELRPFTIDKMVPGGDGMARLDDGRVVFAAGAFPGDVIAPRSVEARKSHVRAATWSLAASGPDRVTPPCPFADACGGCDWMGLARGAQLKEKANLLRQAFDRTGGITLPQPLVVESYGEEVRYRSRARFHVDFAGRIGFFARASHVVVEIPGCLVCRPEIDNALVALRRVDAKTLASLSEIDVRVADEGVRVAVRLVPRVRGAAAPALRAVASALGARFAVSVEGDASADVGAQIYELPAGARLFATPGVFTQVNWPVNVALVQAVLDGARARGVTRFLDAYAGAGNFSLPLLAAGMNGISVESDARAVLSARRAAEASGLDGSGFVADKAEKRLADLARRGERFDLVLLDPPRTGAKEALESVAALAPRGIAYCSCDPVTLARDVATLVERGYVLEEVRGFDMFPSTHHLETLAWLSRSP